MCVVGTCVWWAHVDKGHQLNLTKIKLQIKKYSKTTIMVGNIK